MSNAIDSVVLDPEHRSARGSRRSGTVGLWAVFGAGLVVLAVTCRLFSGVRGPSCCSGPAFPQFARLAAEEYGAQQVWCKHLCVSRSAG